MPEKDTYVTFDNKYIRMTAFKKMEYKNTTVLRFFNTHSEDTALTIELSPIYKTANLVTLGEDFIEALTIEDGKITLPVGAKKIVTIELA